MILGLVVGVVGGFVFGVLFGRRNVKTVEAALAVAKAEIDRIKAATGKQ